MTTKEKKINLGRLTRLQKVFSVIYRATSLISISDFGVHIQGLNNLRDLIPTGYELTTVQRGTKEFPYESHFDFDGVRFYAIHKEAK